MNPLPEPKTVDVIALITRTYGIQEDHALRIMHRVLQERGKLQSISKQGILHYAG